jgi:catechol 2,3-dioxygenase-like lactoylglutathione lyase family enzyme
VIKIDRIDHIVLTVADLDRAFDFYTRVLGMVLVEPESGPKAVAFGSQKINLHQVGREFEPKAVHPTPGSGDICLIARTPLDEIIAHLASCGAPVGLGPVERFGATGPIRSIYFRDPGGNLIEVANPLG